MAKPETPLPGSAEAAASPDAPPVDLPTAERLALAQSRDAARAVDAEMKASTPTNAPTIGRIVHYVAPDRTTRAAVVTYVWEHEEAPEGVDVGPQAQHKQVNLLIFGHDFADTQLDLQTAIRKLPGDALYVATSVAFQDPREPRRIHTWRWPVIR